MNSRYGVISAPLLRCALFAPALAMCAIGIAQDRDSASWGEYSPDRQANYFLSNADLIAIGEFSAPVDRFMDVKSLLSSQSIDVTFTIQQVLKGNLQPGSTVTVRMNSDMLAYPGESISRYEKRFLLFDEKRGQLAAAAIRATAEAADAEKEFEAGEISQLQRDERIRAIDSRNATLIAETNELRAMQRRRPITSHGASFYDQGGVIQSGMSYVIALGSIEGNARYFALGDMGGGIMWGEIAQEIQVEISRLQALRTSGPE
jgi:hypothetical protein